MKRSSNTLIVGTVSAVIVGIWVAAVEASSPVPQKDSFTLDVMKVTRVNGCTVEAESATVRFKIGSPQFCYQYD
jgi:hypothetical protein